MRTLGIVLACLLALIQYPLWLGKGGWLRVWELDRQLEAQQALNARIASRNDALEAEVADLRAGQQALEERARYDLECPPAVAAKLRFEKGTCELVHGRPSVERGPPGVTGRPSGLGSVARRGEGKSMLHDSIKRVTPEKSNVVHGSRAQC